MSFTVKQFHAAPPPGKTMPSIDQHTYSCSSYGYQFGGTLPSPIGCAEAESLKKRGPVLTLYDDNGELQRTLPLEKGCHAFIENDRGKTIDHFYGDEWLTDAERRTPMAEGRDAGAFSGTAGPSQAHNL